MGIVLPKYHLQLSSPYANSFLLLKQILRFHHPPLQHSHDRRTRIRIRRTTLQPNLPITPLHIMEVKRRRPRSIPLLAIPAFNALLLPITTRSSEIPVQRGNPQHLPAIIFIPDNEELRVVQVGGERGVDFTAQSGPGGVAAGDSFAAGFVQRVRGCEPVGGGFRVPGFAVDGVGVLFPGRCVRRLFLDGGMMGRFVHPFHALVLPGLVVPGAVVDVCWLSRE